MSPMLMRSCVLARVIQPPCKNVPCNFHAQEKLPEKKKHMLLKMDILLPYEK